jgi:hypothetical protein
MLLEAPSHLYGTLHYTRDRGIHVGARAVVCAMPPGLSVAGPGHVHAHGLAPCTWVRIRRSGGFTRVKLGALLQWAAGGRRALAASAATAQTRSPARNACAQT